MLREVHKFLTELGTDEARALARQFEFASSEQVWAAADRIASWLDADDEVEVDTDALVSESDSGYWVQCWLYVPAPDDE
jgi:hypothetical protein